MPEGGNGRRRLAGGLALVTAVGFLVARPVMERLNAKSGCVASNARWNADSGVCEYGSEGPVVQLLERSKHCQDLADSQLRECSFSVERLQVRIIGVGTSGAAVSIDGADETLGYGVGVFMGEGCIRVAPGTQLKERDPTRRIEDGFVSTWTGHVYESMVRCRADGLRVRAIAETAASER